MLPFSFADLLSESWRLSLRRRHLWIFGTILSLPLFAQTYYLADIPSQSSELSSFVTTHPREITLFLLITFISSLVGKAGLILRLHQATSLKEDSPLSFSTLRHAIIRGLFIEVFFLVLLLLVALILALPFFIASLTTGAIPPSLHWLALLVVLPVSVIMFIVREFTFFYFLLTRGIGLRSALEASSALFQQNTLLSLQFTLWFLAFVLLFTFSLNLVMLAIVALSHLLFPHMPDAPLILAGSFVALALYEVLRQTLWFQFFQKLAKPEHRAEKSVPAVLKEEATEITGV